MLLLSLSPSVVAYLKLVLIRDYFLKSILKWSSPSSELPVTFLSVSYSACPSPELTLHFQVSDIYPHCGPKTQLGFLSEKLLLNPPYYGHLQPCRACYKNMSLLRVSHSSCICLCCRVLSSMLALW